MPKWCWQIVYRLPRAIRESTHRRMVPFGTYMHPQLACTFSIENLLEQLLPNLTFTTRSIFLDILSTFYITETLQVTTSAPRGDMVHKRGNKNISISARCVAQSSFSVLKAYYTPAAWGAEVATRRRTDGSNLEILGIWVDKNAIEGPHTQGVLGKERYVRRTREVWAYRWITSPRTYCVCRCH